MNTTVAVIGLGYIGLPTALLMAEANCQVTGVDIDQNKLDKLKQGRLPFTEPGLSALFKRVQKTRSLVFTHQLSSSQFYVIAVPTPQHRGQSDLKYVLQALAKIKPVYRPGQVIIIESTIGPQGFSQRIQPAVSRWPAQVQLAHCPERAIPGHTLREMVVNDRIIGGSNSRVQRQVKKLYAGFVTGQLHTTTLATAAFVKVIENTYRMTNIALANEVAMIAADLGINCREAVLLANLHPRVQLHQPGPGVGGHCLPIDPWFLVSASAHHRLIKQALQINQQMPAYIVNQLEKIIKEQSLTKPIIGILGYAYKANVDDIRETPVKSIIKLLKKKYQVLVSDELVSQASLVSTKQLLSTAQVILLLVPHTIYAPVRFRQYSQIKLVYEAVGLWTEKNFMGSNVKRYQL